MFSSIYSLFSFLNRIPPESTIKQPLAECAVEGTGVGQQPVEFGILLAYVDPPPPPNRSQRPPLPGTEFTPEPRLRIMVLLPNSFHIMVGCSGPSNMTMTLASSQRPGVWPLP